MVDLANRGKTLGQIGAELHIAPSTAGRYLRGVGIRLPHRNRRDQRLPTNEILATTELVGKGYSIRDISQILGLHPTTVRWRLRKYAREDIDWRYRENLLPDDGRTPPGS
jgi:DNA-binding CsgD family transcriptional regulator